MPELHLVPIYCGPIADQLLPLAARLERIFDLRVEMHPPAFDPELAFDASRGQYNSSSILSRLLQQAPVTATRILGVIGVDLFVPVLTYVFGEAELGGRAAVVSSFRLDAELYGLPPDQGLLFERLLKESVHELGHTYNLVHCHDGRCVMTSSTYVEGIDLKLEAFCDACLRLLRQRRGRHGAGAS
jgi:archaemetzincin